ncbi:hypothetical protein LR48_Vigan10g239300 [Vigna angularis]|uniref:Uncharacterized protein n=1 Tax=Phaseolus angularis TaxID=3914 RepID=A0A0L9VN77_PHAAN|nr:hypothetical protein LR48_Vigan10g239300 [Vigna angularis]
MATTRLGCGEGATRARRGQRKNGDDAKHDVKEGADGGGRVRIAGVGSSDQYCPSYRFGSV